MKKTENQIQFDKQKKDLSSSIRIWSYVLVSGIRDLFKITDKNPDTFELHWCSPLSWVTKSFHPSLCQKITPTQAKNYIKNMKS